MSRFFEITLSFPVVIFSLLLAIVSVYWLMVCLGVVGIEPVEIDIQAVSAYDSGNDEFGEGLFPGFGFAGVPLAIILTLVSVVGWLVSYFNQLLIIEQLSLGFFYYPLGFASGLMALLIALAFTLLIVRLCKPLLKKISGPAPPPICGQVAIVRSQTVSCDRGTAMLDDGGAGLLLQVRSLGTSQIRRNDRVVLLQYLADEHVYHVISESDFKG
ncbi:hypothetical protein N027_20815 [Pseudomonas syringae USA007]|uniref:Ubiquinone biosynthesis protein UbiH n=2 Tax=Pseudomonas syringae group TaxID=136849 RepID=A0A3M2W567_PSESI|nr:MULTISPECIES: hypothetical protein [Pseudomonas syringae group]MCR8720831.1 hypothetical protein [Pseudomonas syringae]RML46545.1 hypothetical protein ALQ95_00013 [Pseudomonas syringae pv. ribicola]